MLKLTGPQSLRPEKILVVRQDDESKQSVAKGWMSFKGTVSEVIYLGTSTRLLVDLDHGYRLNVLEQNVSTQGGPADHDRRGTAVEARWSPADIVPLTPAV